MLKILSNNSSIISEYLRELRDVDVQHDRQRFERNVEMLGVLAGYELSKHLAYYDHATTTPLGKANTPLLRDKLVISTVLRAGLPVHRGICRVLPAAEPAFIAAARNEDTSEGVKVNLSYVAGPSLEGKILVIADTMLASGHTFVGAYHALLNRLGKPQQIFIISVLASQPGIEYIQQEVPDAHIIACAVDPTLNDDYFIVPGLGDAGDLLYGEKI